METGLVLPDGSPATLQLATELGLTETDLHAQRLREMDDEELIQAVCLVEDERRDVVAQLKAIEDLGKAEIMRRLKERGARAMPPHEWLEACEIEDEWSTYAYDLNELEQVGAMLPDDERVKIIKNIPEYQPPPVPAHLEAGNPRSITALIKKYGEGSSIGARLKNAMTRSHLGEKLKFKRKALPA